MTLTVASISLARPALSVFKLLALALHLLALALLLLPDKLGLIYPPVLVGSEVQLLVGLDLLPWVEANKGAFLERFPDRMAIHYVDCFECVHLIWFGSFTLLWCPGSVQTSGERVDGVFILSTTYIHIHNISSTFIRNIRCTYIIAGAILEAGHDWT
jgi:hypothetical protein